MIAAAILAWKAASIGMRIIAIVGPLLALGTLYGVWHYKVDQRGYRRALSEIAAQDERAIKKAQALRGVFKECRAAGRPWDSVEGRCM